MLTTTTTTTKTKTTTTSSTTTSATVIETTNTTENEKIVKAAISAVVEKTLGKKTCIKTNDHQNSSSEIVDLIAAGDTKKLPGVDIFLNPAKADEKKNIVEAKQGIAKDYFNTSDMAELYPNLFRILWQSTLPCFEVNIL